MALMPPVLRLRSATKALRNSVANTAASSASLPRETFERFFPQVLRNLNRLVVSESRYWVALCSSRIVGNSEVVLLIAEEQAVCSGRLKRKRDTFFPLLEHAIAYLHEFRVRFNVGLQIL